MTFRQAVITATMSLAIGCSDTPDDAPTDDGVGGGGGTTASGGSTAGGGGSGGMGGGLSNDCIPGNDGAEAPRVIGHENRVDLTSTALWGSDGSVHIVFDSFDVPFTQSSLFRVTWDGENFSSPSELALGSEGFTSTPSAVRVGGAQFIYFTVATQLQSGLEIRRCRWEGDGCGAVEMVGPIPGAVRLQSFPRFTSLGGERVAVAFHDATGRPTFASSVDGTTFDAPVTVDAEARTLAHVGGFEAGPLAFTHQTGVTPQLTHVRLSDDGGASWGMPQLVTDQSNNVHDAAIIARLDGDLDVAYIYPVDAFGFSVFRRPLTSTGDLGPEERLTTSTAGDATKPTLVRLPDCRVLLLYAEITARDMQGIPSTHRLGAQILAADAPR